MNDDENIGTGKTTTDVICDMAWALFRSDPERIEAVKKSISDTFHLDPENRDVRSLFNFAFAYGVMTMVELNKRKKTDDAK